MAIYILFLAVLVTDVFANSYNFYFIQNGEEKVIDASSNRLDADSKIRESSHEKEKSQFNFSVFSGGNLYTEKGFDGNWEHVSNFYDLGFQAGALLDVSYYEIGLRTRTAYKKILESIHAIEVGLSGTRKFSLGQSSFFVSGLGLSGALWMRENEWSAITESFFVELGVQSSSILVDLRIVLSRFANLSKGIELSVGLPI